MKTQTTTPRNSIFRILGQIICVALCIYLFLNIMFLDTYSLVVLNSSKKMLKEITEQHNELTIINQNLETEIDNLKNNPHYIEKIARKMFSMVKPGETVFVFRKK